MSRMFCVFGILLRTFAMCVCSFCLTRCSLLLFFSYTITIKIAMAVPFAQVAVSSDSEKKTNEACKGKLTKLVVIFENKTSHAFSTSFVLEWTSLAVVSFS